MKQVLSLMTLLLLAACTTVGPGYTPPPPAPSGKATVILMRGSVGYGGAYKTKFSINHQQIVALYNKGYTYVYLSPGIYHFSAHDLDHSDHLKFNLALQANRTYYIQYTQYYYPVEKEALNILRALFPDAGESLVAECSFKKALDVDILPLPPGAVESSGYDEERLPVHINVVVPPFPVLQPIPGSGAPVLRPIAPTR